MRLLPEARQVMTRRVMPDARKKEPGGANHRAPQTEPTLPYAWPSSSGHASQINYWKFEFTNPPTVTPPLMMATSLKSAASSMFVSTSASSWMK